FSAVLRLARRQRGEYTPVPYDETIRVSVAPRIPAPDDAEENALPGAIAGPPQWTAASIAHADRDRECELNAPDRASESSATQKLQTCTVTRRNVAGIEVAPLPVVFCRAN